ncbi:MAG TPA: DUF1565 domain-containing protein [Polyangiaceae bacterium]|nr:DUF1565 domain-containing protein [Polyangiaceae bacterium]
MVAERGWRWLMVATGVFIGCGGRSGLSMTSEPTGAAGHSGASGTNALPWGVSGLSNGGAGSAHGAGAPAAGTAGLVHGSGGMAAGSGVAGDSPASAGLGGHAGLGGAAAAAGSAGLAGSAGGAIDHAGWYVDPVHGSDRSSGNFDAPFKTLERAASVAISGDTVWLFDGTYDPSTERQFAEWPGHDCGMGEGVRFVADVRLKALNSGRPRLSIAGRHGLCLSGGEVQGLQLECLRADGHAVEVTSGIEGIVDSTFRNCGSTTLSTSENEAALDVSGDALVQLTAEDTSDYSGYPNYTFAAVRDNATLTVYGGTVSALHRAFVVRDSATLSLQGVRLLGQDPAQHADQAIQVLDGKPTVILSNGTIENFGSAIRVQSPSARLSIDRSTVKDSFFGLLAQRAQKSSLQVEITTSHFESLDVALFLYPFAGAVSLSLSDSDFKAVARPLMAMLGGTLSLSDVTVRGCDFGAVIAAYTDSAPLDVSLRRVSVTGCRRGGLSLAGNASSIFDLGTSASAGGNVVRDNQRDATSAHGNLAFVSPAPILISAIGNTWDPNTQGTDENGQCSVDGGGEPLDLTSASGLNFVSGTDNQAILRLAEGAP